MFNSNDRNNSNKKYNNRITYNNFNSYNMYYKQHNNEFNNKQNNNQQAPSGQNFNITGIFIALLLLLTSLIMVFHVINVIDTNNKLKEENSEKKENNNSDNQIDIGKENNDKENESEEKLSIEEKNKNELVKLCRNIDANGSYKYEEYVKYIESFDANKLTEQEKYEVMSKKTYCQNGICIKIEKDGLINYVDCSNSQYFRMTFKEYEEKKEGQNKVNEALNNACSNVNTEGYFDSGAATGIRVTCDKFVCLTEYNDEIITKKCQ